MPILTDMTKGPFQCISLDLITKLPASQGFDSILTIVDHDCSKGAFFIPCKETVDGPGVATLYAQNVFPHYGIPHRVISDRDPCFTSGFTRGLCQALGIQQNISTAYHPQTDGQSERANQSVEQYLRLFVNDQQDDWAHWLPLAQYTHNSWKNSSTKKAPFEIIMGHIPTAHQWIKPTHLPGVEQRQGVIKAIRHEAQEAIKRSQNSMDTGKFKGYQINEKVWLEGKNLE